MAAGTARNVMLRVDDDLCQVCKQCLAADECKGSAFIRLDPDDSPFIDMSRCWGCFTCLDACPHGAVVRHEYGEGKDRG